MNLSCPVLTNNLFLQYGKTTETIKPQQTEKKKTINNIRNNTRNVLNEKYRMYVEQYAKQTLSYNNQKKSEDAVPLTRNGFLSVLILLRLLGPLPKIGTKTQRSKNKEQARKSKRVLQDFKFEQNDKEENLMELVAELEKSDERKKAEKQHNLFDLYLWCIGVATYKGYQEKIKKQKEESELRKRAKDYLNQLKVADTEFSNKVNQEKQKTLLHEAKLDRATKRHYNHVVLADEMDDLQDLYAASNNGIRVMVNRINNILR